MKKLLALLLLPAFFAHAEVVRPAPDFAWESFNGTTKTLTGLKGQPVVLIIAPSPKSGVFKKQIKQLNKLYRQYASREAIFVAAFTQESGLAQTDIPFLYARNAQAIAADYGLEKDQFELVVIGPDRNMDLITKDVTTGERVRDVIDNSQPRQSVRRK